MENISLDPNSIQNLINQLKIFSGIEFKCYRQNFLERRIKSRMLRLGLTNDRNYLDYLISHPEEINLFLERFTINYTYFFRNYEIFKGLCDIIYACKNRNCGILLEKHNLISQLSIYDKIRNGSVCKNDRIKIWSCPCASGDEPYSIAMIFDELKHNIKNFPEYEIVASDIDDHAVNIAKKGYYGDESLKEIPEKYIHKHFIEVDDQLGTKHVLSDYIKNQVEFLVEDITKGHKKNQKYDIIFCRYLLIYINRNFRENLLKILERKLAAGGLLILGKTETLINTNSPFKLIDGRNHFYAKI